MLFNSPVFLFLFLPLTLAIFYGVGHFGSRRAALVFLIGASAFFYSWWNPSYLPLIVASIVVNFAIAHGLDSARAGPGVRRGLLLVGLALNLGALAYFKYTAFLLSNAAAFLGADWSIPEIELPLAISFFTFQQVAFLVDAYRGGERETSPLRYALFVVFFPQLIAGPIVHHKEMMPQFAAEALLAPKARRFAIGLSILSIGLFKKVVIADRIAMLASPIFDGVAAGASVSSVEAWVAALAYTFQLYFDFSGYSDMAIGLGWLFGVRLPLNFYSPYRSTSIIEFWRRWHITLSRFLRDYLYFALGGNRKGFARRFLNLFLTMLLGGIWHGAGWTFVLWGALHGGLLIVNHAGRALAARLPRLLPPTVSRGLSWVGCFVAVVVGWVLFRSANVTVAGDLLGAMFLGQGAAASVSGVATGPGTWALLAALTALSVWGPNVFEIFGRFDIALGGPPKGCESDRHLALAWEPTRAWTLAIALLAGVAILHLSRVSEFLYFQF